jgi:hypothetical protein
MVLVKNGKVISTTWKITFQKGLYRFEPPEWASAKKHGWIDG